MINLPNCPKCGNESSCFRKEKITVNGETMNAVICNGCESIILTYLDSEIMEEILEDKFRDLESKIEVIEDAIDRLKKELTVQNIQDNEDEIIQQGLETEMDKNSGR